MRAEDRTALIRLLPSGSGCTSGAVHRGGMGGGKRAATATMVGAAGGRFLLDAALAARRAVAQHESLIASLSKVGRYGLSAVSVAVALGIALLLEHSGIRRLEFPVFLFEIALVVWY